MSIVKILSFDIGIINLAVCLLYLNKETQIWTIEKWNLINISNIKVQNNIPCSYININKACKKNATYNINNSINYCTIHSKKFTNKTKIISCKTDNYDIIKSNLIKELDKYPEYLGVDYVLIENQPSYKNPKMKAISTLVYDYFLIRGIIDKHITNSTISSIKFVSPTSKINMLPKEYIDKIKIAKTTETKSKHYSCIKKLTIEYCKNLISNDNKWTEYFNAQKKQDDLADCLIQGLIYCKKNNIFTIDI